MTTSKQIQMVMRDMLFVTWAIEPDVVRKMVDARFELDTKRGPEDREMAFISAVCFHVTNLRSGVLPVPNLTFEQVNYRAYVRSGGVPAVFFFDIKVNSRMITALTSFLNVPVHYEDIEITTSQGTAGVLGYRIQSAGLSVEAEIDQRDEASPENKVPPEFITQRFVGYAGAGNAMYRINVEQPGLLSVTARVQNATAPGLERLGLLTADQASQPYSTLFVREGLFGADAPVREW